MVSYTFFYLMFRCRLRLLANALLILTNKILYSLQKCVEDLAYICSVFCQTQIDAFDLCFCSRNQRLDEERSPLFGKMERFYIQGRWRQ